MSLMKPISSKWRDIGLHLKVKQQVLDDIANNPDLVREGADGILRETLNCMEQPSIKPLLGALRSLKINEEGIAKSIEELTNTG